MRTLRMGNKGERAHECYRVSAILHRGAVDFLYTRNPAPKKRSFQAIEIKGYGLYCTIIA
jgi:hypothetical protein